MKLLLKFLLQVPLLVLAVAGIESYFSDWHFAARFVLAFIVLLSYTTGDYLEGD